MKYLINQIYEDWMLSPNVSQSLKKEMSLMNKKEINDHFNKEELRFGTAGIRAIIGPGTNRMNTNIIYKLVDGYAKFLKIKNKEGLVIIARDNRKFSQEFSDAAVAVLTSYGFKVKTFVNNLTRKEELPTATPILSFFIRHYHAIGGINITSSHNPKNYNGIKFYSSTGGQCLVKDSNKISSLMVPNSRIHELCFKENKKMHTYIPLKEIRLYFEAVKQITIDKTHLDYLKKFPIIFTGHHGAASKTLPMFLRYLNYVNVIPVKPQCYFCENFSHSEFPNPEDSQSFKLAEKFASIYHSDIIVATDPDADRAAVAIKRIDGKWKYLNGNEMGIILSYYILKNKKFNRKPYIISTYITNYYIDRIAKNYGAKVYRTDVGFKWIANKIDEIGEKEDFVIGFEEAIGCLCSKINRDKDSFQAIALILEVYNHYQQKGMDFVDVLEEEIFPKFGVWLGLTVSIIFKDKNWREIASKKIDKLAKFPKKNYFGYKLESITFNKIANCLEWNLSNDSWIKFRMSGTEPKLKTYYNLIGSNQSQLSKTVDKFQKIIKKVIE